VCCHNDEVTVLKLKTYSVIVIFLSTGNVGNFCAAENHIKCNYLNKVKFSLCFHLVNLQLLVVKNKLPSYSSNHRVNSEDNNPETLNVLFVIFH